MKTICKDLKDEYDSLDDMVSILDHQGWMTVTPFYDWTIKDTISHLAFFDRAALLSTSGKEVFDAHLIELMASAATVDEIFDMANSEGNALDDEALLEWWRKERGDLLARYESSDPSEKFPWYGPPMSARSSATARLMETWAHGQDVADALKITRPGSVRLKNIVHLGYSTFGWSFVNRGLSAPSSKPVLILESPDGSIWRYGDEDSDNMVSGTALDFCLVVTQRRHVEDTGLIVKGDAASSWMLIAQAFAGPPQDSPEPGSRIVIL